MWLLQPLLQQVYKQGATSGLTTGIYEGYVKFKSFNHGNQCHLIHWDGTHFADAGDCGSIYFNQRDGKFFPFAVHVASALIISGTGENQRQYDASFGVPFLPNALKFYDNDDEYFIYFDLSNGHSNCIQYDFESIRENISTSDLNL